MTVPHPLHPQAKEGIRSNIVKDKGQGEAFDAVVSAQRHLVHFREKRADMVLLMDKSLAVLAHLHRETVPVRTASRLYVIIVSLSTPLFQRFYLFLCHISTMKVVPEIEMQANRAAAMMDDLDQIVPQVELQMGPLLKVWQTFYACPEERRLTVAAAA